MDKELAKRLIPLINNKQNIQLLEEYIDYRIKSIQQHLETNRDTTLLFNYQGQIAELRRFKTLKDEVLARAKEI